MGKLLSCAKGASLAAADEAIMFTKAALVMTGAAAFVCALALAGIALDLWWQSAAGLI